MACERPVVRCVIAATNHSADACAISADMEAFDTHRAARTGCAEPPCRFDHPDWTEPRATMLGPVAAVAESLAEDTHRSAEA